jgi:hypothetical protein
MLPTLWNLQTAADIETFFQLDETCVLAFIEEENKKTRSIIEELAGIFREKVQFGVCSNISLWREYVVFNEPYHVKIAYILTNFFFSKDMEAMHRDES